jgi:hypothetical protein
MEIALFALAAALTTAYFVVHWLIYAPDGESIRDDWQDRPTTAADLPKVPDGPAQGAYPKIETVCMCLRCGGEKKHGERR